MCYHKPAGQQQQHYGKRMSQEGKNKWAAPGLV
jgi:hypothetical protein